MGRTIAVAIGLGACAACRFTPTSAAASDGAAMLGADGSAPGDGPHDAPAKLVGSACGGTLWHADFSQDPTTIDLNGDGVPDFATRDGAPLAGVLAGGIWTVPANSSPLDTRPPQPFTTRVVLDAAMTNLVPTTNAGQLSTVTWINTDFTATQLAPLFVDIRRDSAASLSQTWTAYEKIDAGSNQPPIQASIDASSFGDIAFHHFHLDIDPTAQTLLLTVDGVARAPLNFDAIMRDGDNDEWATVAALGGDSAFDDFQVEVCP